MAKQPSIRPWSRLSSLRSVVSEPTTSPFGPSPKATSQAKNTPSLQNNANASKHIKPQPSSLEYKVPGPVNEPQPSSLEDKVLGPVNEKSKTTSVKDIIEKPNVKGNDGSLQKVLDKKSSKDIEKPNVKGNDGSLQKVLDKKNSGSGSEDSGYSRVITITGENKGAYIEIIQSPKNKSQKVRTARNGVYMNSNVQCVNNSMLLHTSCTHHDPGMQITLSKKPFGKGFFLKEQVDGNN